MKNYNNIINLFKKVIFSLSCIEKITDNNETKKICCDFLNDFISQYRNYETRKNANEIKFKYTTKEIVDFANDCYDKVDYFDFAEDVEYGFYELVEKIYEERNSENG